MSAQDNIAKAYQWAQANRPKVGGFPYLAEALRLAGVTKYIWQLPSCQCFYFTKDGTIASTMPSLINGMAVVPVFNKEQFIKILRMSQNGDSTFPEFLKQTWEAGVVNYEADLIARKVSYFGAHGESYVEDYPAVKVNL